MVPGHLRDKVLLLPALVNVVLACPTHLFSCSFPHITVSAQTSHLQGGLPWSPRLDGTPGYMSSALTVCLLPGTWHCCNYHACSRRLSEFPLDPGRDDWYFDDRGWISLLCCVLPVTRTAPVHSRYSAHTSGRKEQRKEGHRRGIRTSRANRASCREGMSSIMFSSAHRLNLNPRVPLKNTQPVEFGEKGLALHCP